MWPPWPLLEDRILLSTMVHPTCVWSLPFLPHWQVSSVFLSLCPSSLPSLMSPSLLTSDLCLKMCPSLFWTVKFCRRLRCHSHPTLSPSFCLHLPKECPRTSVFVSSTLLFPDLSQSHFCSPLNHKPLLVESRPSRAIQCLWLTLALCYICANDDPCLEGRTLRSRSRVLEMSHAVEETS